MRLATLALVSGAALLLTLLTGCGAAQAATGAQPTATALAPTPTSTSSAPITAPVTLSCPAGSPDLANVRNGGEGALLDTYSGRWGPPAGVAAGSVGFGRYSDTGRTKVLVPSYLPASNRVWSVQYFVDTTQQVSFTAATAIAASILPRDATQLDASVRSGDSVTVHFCSAAMLKAFPPGDTMNGQPMPDSGILTVGYILRADGFVDSIDVGYGCLDATACARA